MKRVAYIAFALIGAEAVNLELGKPIHEVDRNTLDDLFGDKKYYVPDIDEEHLELEPILQDFYDDLAYHHGDGIYVDGYAHGGDLDIFPHGYPVDYHNHFAYNDNYYLDENPFLTPYYPVHSDTSDYDDPYSDGYYSTDSDYYEYGPYGHDYHYDHFGRFMWDVPQIEYPEVLDYEVFVEPTIKYVEGQHHPPPYYETPLPNDEHLDPWGYFNEYNHLYEDDYYGSLGHDHVHDGYYEPHHHDTRYPLRTPEPENYFFRVVDEPDRPQIPSYVRPPVIDVPLDLAYYFNAYDDHDKHETILDPDYVHYEPEFLEPIHGPVVYHDESEHFHVGGQDETKADIQGLLDYLYAPVVY